MLSGRGLPDEHRAYFELVRKYRVPGFLATSLSKMVAQRFAKKAYGSSEGWVPAVVWTVQVMDSPPTLPVSGSCSSLDSLLTLLVSGSRSSPSGLKASQNNLKLLRPLAG